MANLANLSGHETMANAAECPGSLRLGHGEPLSESWVASLPLGWARAYSGVRFTKAEAVGTT